MRDFDKFYKHISDFMGKLSHKNSYIKERILSIMYLSQMHLSANEIQEKFMRLHKENISLPTIYSLLNFLDECGLADIYEQNGIKKYELSLKSHHDHLICEKCGRVIEFHDEIIEQRQDEICHKMEFNALAHTMILYGICNNCERK
ncbi:transcriptional repressor [Campylobacter sp. faydin G-105]|uniref:Fur family transcriptional regulator n=1 Tax=Campylobacter anatolicus TaxID=2829105 RepID=UPI001B95026C|nr:Fur family transcriptional regulator [Campylobacter anatolicus]MBR8462202.1 transcriptional repressor [Campylobacter anatolicus]